MSNNEESSGDDESSSDDEERNFEDDEEYYYEESSEEEEAPSAEDLRLFDAVASNDADAEGVRQALRDGANVNVMPMHTTPLMEACGKGNAEIVGILLDASADARATNIIRSNAFLAACSCSGGNLSTVQLMLNHDNGLLKISDNGGRTPVFVAVDGKRSDIVRFLLDSGADPDAHYVYEFGHTALMNACDSKSLEIVRLLLAAGVDVEARDAKQQTALHYAARSGASEIMLELILRHNANMCAADKYGRRPFDIARHWWGRNRTDIGHLLGVCGNKLTQDQGQLALHKLLKVTKYSFAAYEIFHPPLYPLRIRLQLGKLKLKHLRTLLRALDPELIRNRDDTGRLPIHIACRTNAPVEVLALISELDPTTLHIADYTGALPIHLLCGTTRSNEYASVRYLVEQGGVGTLAARNRQGLLPLHVLCESRNPPLRSVQYLIESFPVSLAMRTNAGQYPFMVAACELSSASLCVVYALVRANPNLVVP